MGPKMTSVNHSLCEVASVEISDHDLSTNHLVSLIIWFTT